MNLFRSEEHLAIWLAGKPPGATLDLGTLSALAHLWWGDRLSPQWRPHTRAENQALLDGLGLAGPFWALP
jgi:hypothetical protein